MSSRLSLRRERKMQISSVLPKDDHNDGTAARTRPFSFHEIMLRRKIKKSGNDSNYFEVEVSKRKISHDSLPGQCEPIQGEDRHKHSTAGGASKLSSGELKNFRSRATDKISVKDDHMRRSRSTDPHVLKDIIKTKLTKHTVKIGRSGITEGDVARIRNRKKIEDFLGDDYDSGNEYKRKKLKDPVRLYKHLEETDRKFQSERFRSRERNPPREHEHGRWHSLGFSSKKQSKQFTPPSYYEEPRLIRKRSRSLVFGKDRSRRSMSPSVSHQRASYRDREHRHQHKLKELPGRKDHEEQKTNGFSNGSHSHSKRYGAFTGSGLGGYSPRKRRSETAARTPSPVYCSPVKKIIDPSPPDPVSDEVVSSAQPSVKTDPSAVTQPSKIFSPVPNSESTVGVSAVTSIPPAMVSIDSIQLTQATRPVRRLHIENLPASSSEKALMEFLNNFLLGLGSNHIHGTQPCISCNIHRERGHAFVEFLTPEDASAALYLDGKPFSGSFLRVKRPKDFVEVATGSLEQIPSVAVAINSTVRDSPNKLFIGGISEALSSDMIMEIVSTFGLLKAFKFQAKDDHINYHCAFLEYLDPSVTLKARAGLSGLKLGGRILTVVQVFPDASALKVDGETETFYGIPELAKPLLEEQTPVLKLRNVFDPELLPSMEEPEVEEALEDVRLECARFGTVRAVDIVRYSDSMPRSFVAEPVLESNESLEIFSAVEAEPETEQLKPDIAYEEGSGQSPGEPETGGLGSDGEEPEELAAHDGASTVLKESRPDLGADEPEVKVGEVGGVCEPGCVLVEFKREEAACAAAHSLHGRVFDDRVISVEYVSPDLYRTAFRKTEPASRFLVCHFENRDSL